jgi:hypothetical protein
MKAPKVPKPPDPAVTAAAQTGSNISTAQAQQLFNMVDQSNPYGSSTYNNIGTWSYKDPSTGKTITIPKFENKTVLSPAQQALLDQEQQFDSRWNQMALDQTGRVRDSLSTPFKYNPGVHEQWAGGIYDKFNADSIARDRDNMEQNLANRGIQYGTKAYDDAIKDFEYGKQKSRDSFMLDSYNTGFNTALTERNQPLNEGSALMNGGQLTQPSWVTTPSVGVQGTDIAGLTQQNYTNQLARAAQQGQAWNALGSLGGMALGGWMASDERVKNVKGTAGVDPESGLPVKVWSYKGEKSEHATPTAQDVVAGGYGDAVAEGPGGVLEVNWSKYPQLKKFERPVGPKYQPPGMMMGPDLKRMPSPAWPPVIREQEAQFSPRSVPKDDKKKIHPLKRGTQLAGALSKLGAKAKEA